MAQHEADRRCHRHADARAGRGDEALSLQGSRVGFQLCTKEGPHSVAFCSDRKQLLGPLKCIACRSLVTVLLLCSSLK